MDFDFVDSNSTATTTSATATTTTTTSQSTLFRVTDICDTVLPTNNHHTLIDEAEGETIDNHPYCEMNEHSSSYSEKALAELSVGDDTFCVIDDDDDDDDEDDDVDEDVDEDIECNDANNEKNNDDDGDSDKNGDDDDENGDDNSKNTNGNCIDNNCKRKTTITTTNSTNCRIGKKRRLSKEDDSQPSEKVFIKDSTDEFDNSPLLYLSDEVLLEILKYCTSNSLMALSNTCSRFRTLVWDRRLWTDFDFSTNCFSAIKILKRIKYLHKGTKSFKIRGLARKFPTVPIKYATITFHMLNTLKSKCPNLETMSILDGFINFEKMSIADFPNTLQSLSLIGCEMKASPTPRIFFNSMDVLLPNLQELYLEGCRWFETHDLIIFSKLPQLKKLSLCGCPTLTNCVPYGSIAARFGFRTLEMLDVRNTPICDSDIQCFNTTRTLRELRLECPIRLRDFVPASSVPNRSRGCCEFEAIFQDAADDSDADANAGPSQLQQQQQLRFQQLQHRFRQEQQVDQQQQQQQQQDLTQNHRVNVHLRVDHGGAAIGGCNAGAPLRRCHPPAGSVEPQLIIIRGAGRNNRISWEMANISNRNGLNRLTFEAPPLTLISDRGIQAFGIGRMEDNNVVWIRAENRDPDSSLRRLTVRHYKRVTDVALRHLAECAPFLEYLDVTGTGVTAAGVCEFKQRRPDCQIITDAID